MNLSENNEKLKLVKAVLNHTKAIADEYIVKHYKPSNDIEENEFYEKIMIEIEEDRKIKSTWAKAILQSEGDDKKAQSIYIKLRIIELNQERDEIIAINEENFKIQKLIEQEKFQLKKAEEEKLLQLKKAEEERKNLKERLYKEVKEHEEERKNQSSNKKNNDHTIEIIIIIILISIIIYQVSPF